MEFISRLFGAFLSLFFADLPFSLDDNDHIPVQVPVPQNNPILPQIEKSFFLTPNFERRWNPIVTSTPKPGRLFFGPESDVVIPEVKVVRVQLPLERYLRDLEATGGGGGKSSKQATAVAAPVKRMGLRV
jgi:hypothetical protein